MPTKVSELVNKVAQRDESRVRTRLGQIEFTPDASQMRVGGHDLPLDEQALASVAKYLKIPPAYIKACPPDYRAETLTFWRDQHSEADTVVEILGSELISIHSPDLLMLPLVGVAEMLERVFLPDDEVITLIRDDKTFQVDITADRYSIEVPNPDRIPGRPEVGDITAGGVRLLAYPNQVKPPVVSTYLHRLVCTNGMTTDLNRGQIKLKGRTIDEVLTEMEVAANEILGGLDDKLAEYARTAEIPVPGSPLAFAMAIARENNLPVRVRDAVMDSINQLPPNASVYDVNQSFTSVANRGVNHRTALALQELGGSLAFEADRIIQRCGTCEQLLAS